jgi:uncharacterized PurR-regulated membrane protein YhhQ (DUF165 family)
MNSLVMVQEYVLGGIKHLWIGFVTWKRLISLVCLYLIAIVLANLSVAKFGPNATILNAFLFIGLDLSSRDKLHEAWKGKGLFWKMVLLIAVGSFLSWLLNKNAGPIAIASLVAFAASASTDTMIYSLLHSRPHFVKINGSNILSAAVDSVLFPALAFGFPLLFSVMIWQFIAKVLGGFVWSIVLSRT